MSKLNWLADIRIWIVLFFLIRLIGITNPPLEISHNWRQTTGLMVARNFYEVNPNILYPRVDDNTGGTGIIAMEFPLLNYIIYLISLVFGYTDWYGRLINLVVTSFGLFLYYKLISRYINTKTAFYSTLILMSSIWFSFARKAMPDTFSLSLVFIGLYYGFLFFEKGIGLYLFLYVLFGVLGVLSKIPAGLYLGLLIIPLFSSYPFHRKWIWIISSSAFILVVYYWYFVWNIKLVAEYGNWYNIGTTFSEGFKEIVKDPKGFFMRFYSDAFCSYLIFGLFLAGIWFLFKNKEKKIGLVVLILFFPVIFFLLKSGHYFTHHTYYIIPIVPLMALIAGHTLATITKEKIANVIVILGIIESMANQQHDFFIKASEKYKLELEIIADSISDPTALIAINGNGNPQQIYFTHRKGWTIGNNQLIDTVFLNKIYRDGCKYVFVNKHTTENRLLYKVLFENENFLVFKLDKDE